MPQITYDASGFPSSFGAKLHGQHQLHFNWSDLLRVGLRVGRPSWAHVYQHGIFSTHEASYRRYLLLANLRETGNGELVKSNVYEWLDPSEKSWVSYFLGLVSAALLSEFLMGKYWMVHLDVYRNLLPSIGVSSRRKPDLISFDTNSNFVVIECKGRTHSPETDLLSDAKDQARAISSIGGRMPIAQIASIAHFGEGTLSVIWHDPSKSTEKNFILPINRKDAIIDHYKPLMSFISSSDRIEAITNNEIEYTVAAIPGTNDFIGLVTDLIRSDKIADVADELAKSIRTTSDEFTSIGMDGSYVQLGKEWAKSQMILEPGDRLI